MWHKMSQLAMWSTLNLLMMRGTLIRLPRKCFALLMLRPAETTVKKILLNRS